MNRPGNEEIALEELPKRLGGEVPPAYPLEGWRTVTLHCQIDAIGPSEEHPDLVKLEVSLPPGAEVPAQPCRACTGAGVIPDPASFSQHPKPVLCPECTACTATAMHALYGRIQCSLQAGHYDEAKKPAVIYGKQDWESPEPSGWHEAQLDRDGVLLRWYDGFDGATPHGAAPRGAQPAGWVVPLSCPTCGPTSVEPHPRKTGVLRCVNCKEHLLLVPGKEAR